MAIDSYGHPDQWLAGRSCGVRNAVPLRSDVRGTHVLPPGTGVAVHEYQSLTSFHGHPSSPCQVCWFKTHGAVQVSLATSRQQDIRDDGRLTLCTGAWRPQAEAEVFLLPSLSVVLKKMTARGFVSLGC